MSAPRHYLVEDDLTGDEFNAVINRAIELKAARQDQSIIDTLRYRSLAMIFEKASTRTRTSFEAGMAQLGGHAINLSPTDSQMSRGEPITDTAKVLSEMVDAVMLRTHQHETQLAFASASQIPVINGLSNRFHPCQLLADIQTCVELKGDIKNARFAWVGPGNNMCNSYIVTAALLDFHLAIAAPPERRPCADLCDIHADHISLSDNPEAACKEADFVVTDVWASMGEESESKRLNRLLEPYQVTQQLLSLASSNASFLHCLPAHRGEEVTAEVIDGSQSVVWQEAGNRLHAQKALLEFLILS